MPSDDYLDRCARCGRSDVDEHWLWFEVSRLEPDDEYAETDLSFCSQAHAAEYLADSEIPWPAADEADGAVGARVIRADLFMFGCGLVAIVLSAIGIVALALWIL